MANGWMAPISSSAMLYPFASIFIRSLARGSSKPCHTLSRSAWTRHENVSEIKNILISPSAPTSLKWVEMSGVVSSIPHFKLAFTKPHSVSLIVKKKKWMNEKVKNCALKTEAELTSTWRLFLNGLHSSPYKRWIIACTCCCWALLLLLLLLQMFFVCKSLFSLRVFQIPTWCWRSDNRKVFIYWC